MDDIKLNPDTACVGDSVWDGVDRAQLIRQLEDMRARSYVPDSRVYSSQDDSTRSSSYPITFDMEQQLADDFAFVAASQPTVGSVSAASVEIRVDEPKLFIRLAANGGIQPVVKETIDEILLNMVQYADRGTSISVANGIVFKRPKLLVERCARSRF